MRIIDVIDGTAVTLELSFEDARRLALICNVAEQGAYGSAQPMQMSGLPREGSDEAEPWGQLFSLYRSAFEMLALSMMCKGSLPHSDRWDNFNVGILRREQPPQHDETLWDMPDWKGKAE